MKAETDQRLWWMDSFTPGARRDQVIFDLDRRLVRLSSRTWTGDHMARPHQIAGARNFGKFQSVRPEIPSFRTRLLHPPRSSRIETASAEQPKSPGQEGPPKREPSRGRDTDAIPQLKMQHRGRLPVTPGFPAGRTVSPGQTPSRRGNRIPEALQIRSLAQQSVGGAGGDF